MKNKQTHAGYVSTVNPIPRECPLFEQLIRNMGFIPLARTTCPQGCKTIETNNNMFGYAKNGWDETRSCGGSSGGEGGLIGSHCSCIGVGSDLGGSLRIPAEWNGLCTLKPAQRYSNFGNCFFGKFSGGSPGYSELGPITRSV